MFFVSKRACIVGHVVCGENILGQLEHIPEEGIMLKNNFFVVMMLGAICESARSMDRAAQSVDPTSRRNPWIVQGSCLHDLSIYRFFSPTLP